MEMVSPMRDAEIHCAWLCLSDGPGGTSWQKDKRPTVLIRVSDEQDAVSFPEELQYYRQRNEELQMEVDKLEEVLAQMEEDSMGQQQVDIVPCHYPLPTTFTLVVGSLQIPSRCSCSGEPCCLIRLPYVFLPVDVEPASPSEAAGEENVNPRETTAGGIL